ncbi:transcriptional regulator ArsR/methyltransferase [Gluconobacter frateurii M-2]|nr:transcriptional regulator ArsR/methyltransferase [Gluconobacter frateurii M-2]
MKACMEQALTIFQALADMTRLRILALLREMELSIGEVAQVLGQSQPRVSRHVKILADAALIERRKEGSWVFLTLGAPEVLEPVFMALDRWTAREPAEIRADRIRLQAIRDVRALAAEDWFETHAAEWDALRSLHVSEQEVEAAILQTLSAFPIGRLVDIGTGTGRMMELLGRGARTVIGFDRSPAMLRLARTKLAEAGLEHADLRQGDFQALPLPEGWADVAVMHQVLHYAQHPAAVIAEAARILDANGRLLVVDFASHNREELRTRDAHVRLGFTDAQMATWFRAAGLIPAEPVALEGELTVKLWLGQRPN